MAGVKILLADEDAQYLLPLVRKFIEGFDNEGEIEVITDASYLETYFQTPRTLDIAVMQESLYQEAFDRHNISSLFFLTEQEEEEGALVNRRIYKYTGADTIYKQVINNLANATAAHIRKQGETRILYVYSPCGGSGKTTVAAGISNVFARSNQRTLSLSMDELQSFGWIMEQPGVLPADVERHLMSQSSFVYNLVKPYLAEENFFILPPFSRMLSSLNIREESFIRLLETIVISHDYDYVVVDGAAGFSEAVSRIMSMSQHILIVTQQDPVSRYKMECLLNNLDFSDSRKFTFVCNKYEADKPSSLEQLEKEGRLTISEYIPREPGNSLLKPSEAGQMKSIQKIAYMFM